MIKASVIGWPIAHSRSPIIHGHWLKHYDIEGDYERISVEPENLSHFIGSLRDGDHVGTNVTIPHKEAAVRLIDDADERVRRTGSLNTIWREGGQLRATSSDGPGFVANFQQTLPHHHLQNGPVLVLGAGGSARAIIDELLRQGVARILIFNRTEARANQLATHFGPHVQVISAAEMPEALKSCHTLINTTSAGLQGKLSIDLPWRSLAQHAAVADIVYIPLITPFLREAEAHGHATVSGLGMLLHQAVVGFSKWFGVTPVVDQALFDMVARNIDPSYRP